MSGREPSICESGRLCKGLCGGGLLWGRAVHLFRINVYVGAE